MPVKVVSFFLHVIQNIFDDETKNNESLLQALKKIKMKKLILLLTVLFAAYVSEAQNVAINTDGSAAHASAILDVKSSDKGILIPRVSLTNVSDPSPIASPAAGLLVYNTNGYTVGGDGPGYYYWGEYGWTRVVNSTKLTEALNLRWSTYGNAGTYPSINFIGTTDDVNLVFKRNNIRSGLIGDWNTSFGYYSLSAGVVSGSGNSAFGTGSLKSNTSGSSNTAVGNSTLYKNTTGKFNIAVGENALSENLTGEKNTAAGGYALKYNTGTGNTGVGYYALYSNNAGTYNTAIGYMAGVSPGLTNATAIGANASASLSNTLILGGTGDNAVKVGIGTPVPATDLEIKQTAGNVAGAGIKLIYSGGTGYHWRMAVDNDGDLNLYKNGNISSYFHRSTGAHVVVSDIRMKKDINNMGNVLDQVLQLEPKTYHYNDNEKDEPLTFGFIAQEVEKVFPELVNTKEESGMKAIAYENFSVIAIQAIKEQQKQIEELKKEINELRSHKTKKTKR